MSIETPNMFGNNAWLDTESPREFSCANKIEKYYITPEFCEDKYCCAKCHGHSKHADKLSRTSAYLFHPFLNHLEILFFAFVLNFVMTAARRGENNDVPMVLRSLIYFIFPIKEYIN